MTRESNDRMERFEVAVKMAASATAERARIRRAIAPALRELRRLARIAHGSEMIVALFNLADDIDAATKAPKRTRGTK